MNSSVGLIGLGLVGSALTERFQAAGFTVHGFDIDPTRARSFTGMHERSAIDVGRACRRIVLSLPTTEIVRTVLAELDSVLQSGDIILDTTTGDPDAMTELGQMLQDRGIQYVDATIAGSSAQVRSGDVIVMLGGTADAVGACADVIGAFARRSFHLGPCGAGARMKLVVNLVLGLHRAVLAEGLSFAQAYGVDPAVALEVLHAGPTFSRVMETKGKKMLERDFEAQARLSQHLKDVRLIHAEANKCAAKIPLTEVHQTLLEALEAAGYGQEDNSAIMRAFAT